MNNLYADECYFIKAGLEKQALKDREESNIAAPLAAGVGVTVGGAGYIDTRKKTDLSTLKKLDPKTFAYQPGDVMVGADTPADSVIRNIRKDTRRGFRKGMNQAAGRGSGVIGRTVSGIKEGFKGAVPWATTFVSKIGDPKLSHAETVVSKNKSGYIGGGKLYNIKDVTDYDGAQFVIMRANKKPTADQVKNTTSMLKLDTDHYNSKGSFKAQVKDWLLPKFNSTEKDIAPVAKGDISCFKGVCSTAPGAARGRTVGGKHYKDALPKDFLRSGDYTPVGFVGKGKTFNQSLKGASRLFRAAPHVARLGAGAAAAAATYGSVKGIQKLKKRREDNNTPPPSLFTRLRGSLRAT